MYYWGGRQEQEIVAEMRQGRGADSETISTDADAECGMANLNGIVVFSGDNSKQYDSSHT